MRILFPLGLLALVGIPVVVLIYILKNKYNEQTVPSTYLWRLSERFYKRRNPLSGLTGVINLILQILTVLLLSFALARPVFILPNTASEYCFILDASGSMKMESAGESRFSSAKNAIAKRMEKAKGGSTFTLVIANTEADVLFERLADKKLALETLRGVECSDGGVDEGAALTVAQKYFDENPSLVTCFYTDTAYSSTNGVEIVNVASKSDVNYAVNEVTGTLEGGTLTVRAEINAYGGGGERTLSLRLNGETAPARTQTVTVEEGTPTPVTFTLSVETYSSFCVAIAEPDALVADNEFVSYNQKSESSYDILLVSETPFFLQAALDALTDSKVDVLSPAAYAGQTGYGLYIFQSFTPNELPDAAVWLINSQKSVADSGFGIRGLISLEEPAALVKSDSTATAARKLLLGVEGRNIFISEYVKYSGMYAKFTTLFSYDSHPLVFAGVNALGNREVVIGFDLHKADFSLSTDFVALLGNLVAYSCPDVLDKTEYAAGEDVSVNITANVLNVKGISPRGEEIYVDTSTDVGTFRLTEVGTYTVRVSSKEGVREYRLFAGTPKAESVTATQGGGFALSGEQRRDKTDGEYDPLAIIFLLLALVFAADWGVYCYEKYQLR